MKTEISQVFKIAATAGHISGSSGDGWKLSQSLSQALTQLYQNNLYPTARYALGHEGSTL